MNSCDPAMLYCRFIESVVNHRRLDRLDQFLAADVVEHVPARSVGLQAAQQTLAGWLAAFPDLHLRIEDLVVDGDHLMARLTATGTHHGPLPGLAAAGVLTQPEDGTEAPAAADPELALGALAPTGKRVRVPVFEAWAVPDGRCVERWLHLDGCQLLRQLGLSLDGAVGRHPPSAGVA